MRRPASRVRDLLELRPGLIELQPQRAVMRAEREDDPVALRRSIFCAIATTVP